MLAFIAPNVDTKTITRTTQEKELCNLLIYVSITELDSKISDGLRTE